MRNCATAFLGVAVLLGLCRAESAQADLVAYWNFNGLSNNTNNGTTYAPDQGAGLITLVGWTDGGISSKSGSLINAIGADPAGQALDLSGEANVSAMRVYSFNMAGLVDPILTFADRRGGQGFTDIQVSWSTDGVMYTDFGTPFEPSTGNYALRTLDFSSVDALDGSATAFIKFTFDGATNQSAFYRLDNAQINAGTAAIPEPSGVIASGAIVALLLGFGLRQRNRPAQVSQA